MLAAMFKISSHLHLLFLSPYRVSSDTYRLHLGENSYNYQKPVNCYATRWATSKKRTSVIKIEDPVSSCANSYSSEMGEQRTA